MERDVGIGQILKIDHGTFDNLSASIAYDTWSHAVITATGPGWTLVSDVHPANETTGARDSAARLRYLADRLRRLADEVEATATVSI